MKYSEKLQDPRWQKKRLEIFERDGWRCQWCPDEGVPLSVHHFYYEKGLEPWDYPNEDLITTCRDCHDLEYTSRHDMEQSLLDSLRRKHYKYSDIEGLVCVIDNLPNDCIKIDRIILDYVSKEKTHK